MKGNIFNKKGDYIMIQEFYGNITITMQTLYYSLLWLAMMLIGGACYEQRLIQKFKGKKLKTLELAGWVIIVTAMLGLAHGVLAVFHLIISL